MLICAATAAALGCTPALAADLSLKAPPPAIYGWTGFYVGANAGYAWSGQTASFSPNDPSSNTFFNGTLGSTPPGPMTFSGNGGLGGLQAGYNWQLDRSWLVGIEADFDWVSIGGAGTSNFLMFPNTPLGGPANIQGSQNLDWFGTLRGRLGFLPAPNTLLYATGGLAYGHTSEQYILNGAATSFSSGPVFGFLCTSSTNCFAGSSSQTGLGYAVGAGVEYAPWNGRVTLRAEYLHIGLPGATTTITATTLGPGSPTPSSLTATSSRLDLDVFRGGVNWRF